MMLSNNKKAVFVSEIMPFELLNELNILGLKPVVLPPVNSMFSEIRYHPDIICINVMDEWLFDSSAKHLFDFIKCRRIQITLSEKYPSDCTFNNIIIGNKVIAGKKNDVSYMPDVFEIIRVNQGYVRCSTVTVNENAFITSDESIYNVLKQMSYDVLKVTNDGILLNGFSNGFIGGCSGKIADNMIVFSGDIKSHKDYLEIKSFCNNYKTDCVSLTNKCLYDYGGIVLIT